MTQIIPIQIPPGPKNSTPDLKIVYSSAGGGSGLFGEGWGLPMGTIERSTKRGTPRCLSDVEFDNTDAFILTLNGAVVELSPAGTVGGEPAYRPRTDQSFLEAIRHGNTWEVIERSGMRYFFGETAPSRLWRGQDVFSSWDVLWHTCDYTSVWGITRVEDPNANRIDVSYKAGKSVLVPDTIAYGGHTALAHPFEVKFFYLEHTDPTESWRRGVHEEVVDLVDRIEVWAGTQVRTYDLRYDHESGMAAGCAAAQRALLCEVAVDALPTQKFEYAPASFGMGETIETHAAPGGFQQVRSADSDADVFRSVMDMNGDGLNDFVSSQNVSPVVLGSWDVWYGQMDGTGFSPQSVPWSIPVGATVSDDKMQSVTGSSLIKTRRGTLDITGDGIVDYVDADENTYTQTNGYWKVYQGFCSPSDAYDCGFSTSPVLWKAHLPFIAVEWAEDEPTLLSCS